MLFINRNPESPFHVRLFPCHWAMNRLMFCVQKLVGTRKHLRIPHSSLSPALLIPFFHFTLSSLPLENDCPISSAVFDLIVLPLLRLSLLHSTSSISSVDSRSHKFNYLFIFFNHSRWSCKQDYCYIAFRISQTKEIELWHIFCIESKWLASWISIAILCNVFIHFEKHAVALESFA